jgi:hypothetical protein
MIKEKTMSAETQLEREEKHLEEMLEDGRLTTKQFDKELLELHRDSRGADERIRMKVLARDDDITKSVFHRAGITNCPHCDYEPPNRLDRLWFQLKHLRFIVMDSCHYKVAAIAVISSCPKCGELSWVHQDVKHLCLIDYYPKAFVEAVQQKHTTCVINGCHEWVASPCATCALKKEVTFDYLRPHVKCAAQDFFVPTTCKMYKTRGGEKHPLAPPPPAGRD